METVNSFLAKITNKFQRLLLLPTSAQNKVNILRSLQWSYLYYMETASLPIAEIIAKHIDSSSYSSFLQLLNLEDTAATRVRVNLPLEDGGGGILPYYDLFPYLYQRAVSRANSFLEIKNLPTNLVPQDMPFTNLQAAWKQLFKLRMTATYSSDLMLSNRLYLKTASYQHWSTVWPTNLYTTLNDEVYKTAMRIRYEQLPTIDRTCGMTGTNFKTMQAAQFTQHIFSCVQCVRRGAWLRHEQVVTTILKTLKFYNIIAYIPPSGFLPKPNHHRGGTDLIANGIVRNWHIDVKVSKSAQGMQNLFTSCIRSYEAFEQVYGLITFPYVMSIYGDIHHQSIQLLEQFVSDMTQQDRHSIKAAIISNTQCAVLKGIHQGLMYVGLSISSAEVDMDEEDSSSNTTIAAGGVTAVPTSSNYVAV